jgi:hypothetical protein
MNRRAAVPVWLQLARLSCLSRLARFRRLVRIAHFPRLARFARLVRMARLPRLAGMASLPRLVRMTRLPRLARFPRLARMARLPRLVGMASLPRLVRIASLPRFARLVACLAAAVTTAAVRSASAAPPPVVTAAPKSGAICDSGTAITLIGIDTEAGRMLFAVAGPGGGAGSWIVELDGAGREAHAYPDKPGARFAGSVGPGPVVAVEPCGAGCLQPVRWNHGAWQPLGEPVTLPAASTVAATYDAAGAPWLVAHGAGTQEGQVQTWSFRYEGRQWKSRGGLAVAAVGQPQALPSPQSRDGVVSGTGLFSASARPSTWVQGLPGVAPGRRGQLLALPGTDAAYLSSDGVAYLSSDNGKTWRRSTWTPWGGDTTGMWRQGTEYVIDLPFGDHRGALQLVWFDRRRPAAERVVLTRLGAGGTWAQLAEAANDVTSRNGEHLPVTQVLVPHEDTWILLSGCAATATGSGLVLRSFEKGEMSEARFVPIAKQQPSAPPAAGAAPAPPP